MLLIRARAVPCMARTAGSSFGRETTRCPSSIARLTWVGKVRASSPLGPLTFTDCPLRSTWTPLGSVMGFLPTRDTAITSRLPNFADDLAAHAQLAGACAGHYALGRRKNSHAHP